MPNSPPHNTPCLGIPHYALVQIGQRFCQRKVDRLHLYLLNENVDLLVAMETNGACADETDTCCRYLLWKKTIQQSVGLLFLADQLQRLLVYGLFQVGSVFLHHFHNRIGNVHSIRHRWHEPLKVKEVF